MANKYVHFVGDCCKDAKILFLRKFRIRDSFLSQTHYHTEMLFLLI